ncbi:MAG: hypothetical protein ACR2GY_08025 [Phycisphaerales bacterium]
MTALTSRQVVEASVAAAQWKQFASTSEEQQRTLRSFLIDLVSKYYLAEDPLAAIDYLASRGHRVCTAAEMEQGWPMADRLSQLSQLPGVPPLTVSTSDDLRDIYAWIREALAKTDNGINRPRMIAAAGNGFEITIGTRTGEHVHAPGLGHTLPPEAWYGGIGQSSPGWVRPGAEALQDQTDANQSILMAEAGIFFEFADQIRYPVTFTCAWDAQARRWILLGIAVRNYPRERMVATWQL